MDHRDRNTDQPHVISVCTRCVDTTARRRPGERVIAQLSDHLSGGFRVVGVDCLAGCGNTCVVSYAAPGKATWVFGNITACDLPDLVRFAQQYAGSHDAWFRGRDCPPKLCDNTLARVPGVGA